MAAKGYWREISAVLVLKTIGIILLYCLVTASLGPSGMTPASVADHLAPGDPNPPTGQPANPMPAR